MERWKIQGPVCKACLEPGICCTMLPPSPLKSPPKGGLPKPLDLVKESLCCFKHKEEQQQQQKEEKEVDACGLFSFYPTWLQKLANKKVFLALFCLTSVLQGMFYTYFVSVLTTIEKLYQIQSKTTGIIMSATEIGQIGGALFLTYYGGQGHRPKWIACGMLVFAAASFFCATPHFLYAETTPRASPLQQNASQVALRDLRTKLCRLAGNDTLDAPMYNRSYRSAHAEDGRPPVGVAAAPASASSPSAVSVEAVGGSCGESRGGDMTPTVLAVFFVSLLLVGIGATAVYTLGIPYIDDNVATRESPLYFGITIGVRIFGPVVGFLLGSFCTSIYVNFPFESPEISPDNPQWVGAWWLGVLIVGASLVLTAFPMMAFPKKLPKPTKKRPPCCPPTGSQNAKPTLKEFPATIRRLLGNEILMYRTASSVLHILPIAGLYTFLPKYLESQFQLTAAIANMVSGVAGILVMGFGIFASGTFMRTYKPSAQFVARWIAACAALYAAGMLLLMLFGCPLNSYVGLNAPNSEYEDLSQRTCNATCGCKTGEFAPICTSEGVTYLSPCLAGCTTVLGSSYDQFTYKDCMCLGANVTATNGLCPLQCNNLLPYVFVFAVFVLIHSTSEVGSMLLTLRCVETKDKAMALGLIAFSIGLFGNVPCPILYGAVVDSACLFWEDNCGEQGACRLYDPSKFRAVFHGVTAAIMVLAFAVDLVVCRKARHIQFQEEEETTPEEAPLNTTTDSTTC